MRTYISKADQEAWAKPVHPSERTWLFFMDPLPSDRYEQHFHYPAGSLKVLQHADYAFVREDLLQYPTFKMVKNRSGGRFDNSDEYHWLKSQFPSIEFYHTTSSLKDEGFLCVYEEKDLVLIKTFYGY